MKNGKTVKWYRYIKRCDLPTRSWCDCILDDGISKGKIRHTFLLRNGLITVVNDHKKDIKIESILEMASIPLAINLFRQLERFNAQSGIIDTEDIFILYSPTVIGCTINALILWEGKPHEFYCVTCVKDKWSKWIDSIPTTI